MTRAIHTLIALFMMCSISFGATTVKLTSSTTGTLPFTVGLAFKKGDVAVAPTLDMSNYQVKVKRLWNDGSVKIAVASGYATMTAGVQKTINVNFSGTLPTGTPLTAADIATAAPTASVQIGSIGTVSLSSLLATPWRTWISGPEMVEVHYKSLVGSSTTMQVSFYVKMYRSGEIYIRAIVDNGFFDVPPSTETYVPTVIIGGTTVYNHGGTALTHYGHQRWYADGWTNITNPNIKITSDTEYLSSTLLVPNYWKTNPSETALNAQTQVYVPLDNADWNDSMGATGGAKQIGILPLWDALYLASGGDVKAYDAMIANANSLNSYGIIRRDSTTGDTPLISAYPTIGYTTNSITTGAYTWNDSHHGSVGYLEYIVTGDYFYVDLMQDQAYLNWYTEWTARGSGTSRIFWGQTRGMGWKLRTNTQTSAIVPLSPIQADITENLSSNVNWYKNIADGLGTDSLGFFYEYNADVYPIVSGGPAVGIAPWMQFFGLMSFGNGSHTDPLPNMTNYLALRDFWYKGVVGIFGDSSGYCFTRASQYAIRITDGTSDDPSTWYSNWKQVEVGTFGTVTCANTLLGEMSSTPESAAAQGPWGIAMSALVFAVEDNAPGASEAWNRLIGATNFSAIEDSGFYDTPTWGLWPRSIEQSSCSNTPTLCLNQSTCEAASYNWCTDHCQSTTCTTSPTCSDGAQNGDETGVDCGGSCPACSSPARKTMWSGFGLGVGKTINWKPN